MCVDTVTSSSRVESFETRNMSSRAWEWSGVELRRVECRCIYVDTLTVQYRTDSMPTER